MVAPGIAAEQSHSMHLINNDLADLLGSVKTPGDFYAAGVCAMHSPLLRVKGVGPIALPLLAADPPAVKRDIATG